MERHAAILVLDEAMRAVAERRGLALASPSVAALDDPLEDLGLDSRSYAELIDELERRLAREIPFEDSLEVRTVRELIALFAGSP